MTIDPLTPTGSYLGSLAFLDDLSYLESLADTILQQPSPPPHPTNLTVYDQLVCELDPDTQHAIFAAWPTG